jgi:hypothetical protein
MSNLDLYDWSTFTANENAIDLLGRTIRKSLTSDFFNGKTRFRARALDDQMTLSALQSRGINASNTGLATGESHAFRARIIDENSPHAFLPDPCDPAWSGTKEFTQRVIAMHTLFITSDQAEYPRVTRGDIVYVELEKSNNSYNLDKGTFLRLLSTEAPDTSGQCFALKLSQLPLEAAIPMAYVPKTDPICTRRDGKCADIPEEQKPGSPDADALLLTESQAADWDLHKRRAEYLKIMAANEKLSNDLKQMSKENILLSTGLDGLGIILDLLGLLGLCGVGEVIATPATLISLCLNLYRNDIFNAMIDLIALIPVAGKLAKAGKLGAAGARWTTGVGKSISISRKAGKIINYFELAEGVYTGHKGSNALFGIIPPKYVAEAFKVPDASGVPYYKKFICDDVDCSGDWLSDILHVCHVLGISRLDEPVFNLRWFAKWVRDVEELKNNRWTGDPCDEESNPNYPEKCFIPPAGWEEASTIEDWLEEIDATKEEYKAWMHRETLNYVEPWARGPDTGDYGAPLIASSDGNV